MSQRASSTLAWALWVLGAALALASIALVSGTSVSVRPVALTAAVSQGFGVLALGLVGLVLAARRPQNSLGWVYLLIWDLLLVGATASAFAHWAADQAQPPAGTVLATWVMNWAWAPPFAILLTFPFLLYPTGHLPSRRWRPFAWSAGVVIALWSVSFAFEDEDFANTTGAHILNPYTPGQMYAVFNVAKVVLAITFVVLVAGCIASLVTRFRRSNETERAQLKWLLFAGAFSFLPLFYKGDHGTGGWIDIATGLGIALIPISMAVAVLRYRLYDIDRIISRTASYAIVTGILIATYALAVWLISHGLDLIVTGVRQGGTQSSSSVVVAAATLTAAAVARPILRRVQTTVDRRFDRTRYDGQRSIDEFGSRLRDEVDPDNVAHDLMAVVSGALQPSQVTLWTAGH
ncbi:MAG: hypothetical protein WAN48_00260 [Actinomycetes bacterium]